MMYKKGKLGGGGRWKPFIAILAILVMILVLLVIIFGFGIFDFILHGSCVLQQDELDLYKQHLDSKDGYYNNVTIGGKTFGKIEFWSGNDSKNVREIWFKKKVYGCDENHTRLLGKTQYFAREQLGFNRTFWDFVYPDLIVGLLMGFWIYLVSLASAGKGKKKNKGASQAKSAYENGWLTFLGDKKWKILLLAVIYAVIMQIPFVNTGINVAVFDFVRDGPTFDIIIRSVILAFYIGLLPSFSEEFVRYKMRKRNYESVIAWKYDRDKVDKL